MRGMRRCKGAGISAVLPRPGAAHRSSRRARFRQGEVEWMDDFLAIRFVMRRRLLLLLLRMALALRTLRRESRPSETAAGCPGIRARRRPGACDLDRTF